MDASTIRELYAYNRWANAQVLTSISGLTDEQLTRDLGASHRSIRDTLAHILHWEWGWLQRWTPTPQSRTFSAETLPDVAALKAGVRIVESAQAELLESLTDGRLAGVVGYVNGRGETWAYPLWQQLYHVVNHSSHHRGQVVSMIRQLGCEPATTDFLAFQDEVAGLKLSVPGAHAGG
jgi:uncharacterized damage-inducible protein DinB